MWEGSATGGWDMNHSKYKTGKEDLGPMGGSITHYNFGLRDPEMDKIFGVDLVTVFNEDLPILEAQQRNLELRPDAPRIDIKVDAAPLAARRMLEAMIQREADAVTSGVRAG